MMHKNAIVDALIFELKTAYSEELKKEGISIIDPHNAGRWDEISRSDVLVNKIDISSLSFVEMDCDSQNTGEVFFEYSIDFSVELCLIYDINHSPSIAFPEYKKDVYFTNTGVGYVDYEISLFGNNYFDVELDNLSIISRELSTIIIDPLEQEYMTTTLILEIYKGVFGNLLGTIKKVQKSSPGDSDILVMMYGQVISAYESFIGKLVKHFLIEYIQISKSFFASRSKSASQQDMTSHQFSLQEIVVQQLTPIDCISKYLENISFHNVGVVESFLDKLFNIKLGEDKLWLKKAVENRHHCIHRMGYDYHGKKIVIENVDIDNLIINIENLINRILEELPDKLFIKYNIELDV